MNRWTSLLASTDRLAILGVIHLQALPGSPRHTMKVEEIIARAMEEAEMYSNHKLDGIIIENKHDIPFVCPENLGPEVVSCMTAVCTEVRKRYPQMPLGVQIMAGCNKEAMAVALAADCDFVRVEGYVYAHVADEGFLNSCAGSLLRYRTSIGAKHISVLCDVKKKHSSHAITSDVSVQQMAWDAEFSRADAVIVTGVCTAAPTEAAKLKAVKEAVSIPVLVGSGVTAENIRDYSSADAVIVGSYFKKDGDWTNHLDDKRIEALVNARNLL